MPTDTKSRGNIYYSYDARSEYPYVMIVKKFPMESFALYRENVDDLAELQQLRDRGFALLFDLHVKDLECRESVTVPYISFSKCESVAGEYRLDNGRILGAEYAAMTVTEIDFDIIHEQYTYSKVAIQNVYIARYDYLPEPIVNHVRDGFYDKCGYEERGEKGTYYYDRCKNQLNGNFGMMFTDPVRDEQIVLDELEDGKRWKTQTPDINEALAKFYRSRNSFLCYQWGVWTTAHARRHHQNLINAFGAEFVYGDTDSAKGTDSTGAVAKRVELLNRKIEAECIPRGAYYDMRDGRRLYMGVFVAEDTMTDFKTMGAKKYAYVDSKGELHVTISGVPKKSESMTSAAELGSIDNFDRGFTFTHCGGSELRYHDLAAPVTVSLPDDNGRMHKVTYGSNISIVDSTYTLGLDSAYEKLIKTIQDNNYCIYGENEVE